MSLGRQGFSGEVSLAWMEPGASDAGKWEFRGAGEAWPSRGGWGLPREGSHLCRRGDCLLQGSGAGTGLWQCGVNGVWGGWGGREFWGLGLCPPVLCPHPVPTGHPRVTLRTDCSQCRAGVSGPSTFAHFVIAPLAVCLPWPLSGGFTLAPFSLPGGFHLVPLPL